MARVTFTNNVYPYVKGDVVDLDKDQQKEVDAYIKRWNIKDAYETEGGKKSAQPKSKPQGSDTKPKQNKATATATNEGEAAGNDNTPPADTEKAIDAPEDKGNPAVEGDDENPPVEDETEGGDDSGDTTTDDSNK